MQGDTIQAGLTDIDRKDKSAQLRRALLISRASRGAACMRDKAASWLYDCCGNSYPGSAGAHSWTDYPDPGYRVAAGGGRAVDLMQTAPSSPQSGPAALERS